MTRPIARADALALLAPFRANDWPTFAAAGRRLLPQDGAVAGLVRAFAAAAMAPSEPARLAALEAARSALPDLARYGFVLPIQAIDPASLPGIAIQLDRLLTYAAADAFLLEYPKCGRTWLRMMIGRAVARAGGPVLADPTDLARLAALRPDLPRLEVTHDDDPELKRVEDIARDKGIYAHCRVLLQVRDPRDVAVSYFFHRTTRNHEAFRVEPFAGTLAEFVRHPRGGIPNIVAFYNAWAAGRAAPTALLRLDYEDLVADPAAGLTAALEFLGLPAPDAAGIAATVEECRFERMQALE
ncbi:sulfotransferase domain-containing protein, partial [Stella sp.]|uniref:sulfotransferase domain-containing protein n=1 Tax=Stella sp. TaxID=2912054 RepID=UPI0035B42F34